MKVRVGQVIHGVRYFDGAFVDTKCGLRIHGTNKKEYELLFDKWGNHELVEEIKATCPDCQD